MYFHRGKKECDFIIKHDLEIVQAIQVCYSLNDAQTKDRELRGLSDALSFYNQAEGLIITADETAEEEFFINNRKHIIRIMPLWKWLL